MERSHRARGVGGPRHDTYATRKKLVEPSACTGCGAVFNRGRWTWHERPSDAKDVLCPACRRIRDSYPGGLLHIEGDLGERSGEIVNLFRNIESAERSEHPLERIMHLHSREGAVEVATTGIHLARRFAEALRRTYHERVSIDYLVEQDFVRVKWCHGPNSST
jgi:hypothetical protein